jgi:hypothetical protein
MSENKLKTYQFKNKIRAAKILAVITNDSFAVLILDNDTQVQVDNRWFQYWHPAPGDMYVVANGTDARIMSISEFLSNWEEVKETEEETHF